MPRTRKTGTRPTLPAKKTDEHLLVSFLAKMYQLSLST